MQKNELYGGLVIPEDFTRDLASIAQPQTADGNSKAATIEVLFNNGAGSLPSAQGKEIVRHAANPVNSRASGELLRSLQSSRATVKPTMIPLISNPVSIVKTDLIPAGAHTGHGMGAFYIAVVTTIGGFLAANIVSAGIDFVTGHGTMGPAMARLRGDIVPSNLFDMFKVKLTLLAVSIVISAAVVTWLTSSVWGTPASSVWGLFGLILLGMFAIGALTLFFIALLGTPGVLLALLFTTILGIPSAAGIFPYEMLPRFYQILSEVMPVRFLSDAVRSIVFFDSQRDAGLTTGVWALVVYGAVSTLIGTLVSWWMARQRQIEASKMSEPVLEPAIAA